MPKDTQWVIQSQGPNSGLFDSRGLSASMSPDVLVGQGYHSRGPDTGWLTDQVHHLSPEARNPKSRCWQDWCLMREGSVPWLLDGHLLSVSLGHLPSVCLSVQVPPF